MTGAKQTARPVAAVRTVEAAKDEEGIRDSHVLHLCAKWRRARSEQEANWARFDETMYGHLPSRNHIDTGPLGEMREMEDRLKDTVPETIFSASEMLRVAVRILAHRAMDPDPEITLNQGPVLEVCCNVLRALEHCVGGEIRLEESDQADPIFAAIELHRSVVAAIEKADPPTPDRLMEEFKTAHAALLKTRSVSVSGLIAFLGYIRNSEHVSVIDREEVETVLDTIQESCLSLRR
jgi:hypothetical protein